MLPDSAYSHFDRRSLDTLIVRDLASGCRRFGELQRSLDGISPKSLSARLRRLEEAGIVTRSCFAEMPPRVEYGLTDKGRALLAVIESMRDFGLRWLSEAEARELAVTGA